MWYYYDDPNPDTDTVQCYTQEDKNNDYEEMTSLLPARELILAASSKLAL